MTWFDVLILAVVQGVAEFLPISSSGHLVLLGALLNVKDESATLDILLHTGSLGSILVVFWKRIWALLWSDRRVIPMLVVGTLPAVLVGLTLKLQFPHILRNPLLTGCMLLVTGGLLLSVRWLPQGHFQYTQFSLWRALVVGCFQAVAILPGISRSGSTIVGGRLLGLKNEDAVTFSFLLAIPAILGATVLALKDLRDSQPSSEELLLVTGGALVAFVIGIGALLWLIRWARQGRIEWFAYWCIPVGLLTIFAWQSGYGAVGG